MILGPPDYGPGALVWFRTDRGWYQPVLSPSCPGGTDVVRPHREREIALDLAEKQHALAMIGWAQRPQFVNEVCAFARPLPPGAERDIAAGA